MTLSVEIINGVVLADDRTATLGGSFWYTENALRVYAPTPLLWAWDKLYTEKAPILLDIGASTGCFTLLAAVLPCLTVYAAEPVPLTREVLTENVRLNDLEAQVWITDQAFTDKHGVGTFHLVNPPESSALSMLGGHPSDHKAYQDIEVPMTSVDAFCQQHGVIPTLIKIDTEGNELSVLQGAKAICERFHPFMIVEYSELNANQYGYHPDQLVTLLKDYGYTVTRPTEDPNDLYAEPA